jgi:predicted nucleotidyltransferase
MSFLFSELRRVTNDLHQSGVAWCLVGGLGTSVYVEPRTTKDIDIVVSVPDEAQGDNLKDLLLTKGYTSPQILMHTTPTRRMGWRVFIPPSREASIPLDILVSACGIENEIVASSTAIEILPGLSLPVASLGHLIAMKVLSQNPFERLQDRVDLLALLRNATEQDRAVVERSLEDIANRGFSGGRNLVAELHGIETGQTI